MKSSAKSVISLALVFCLIISFFSVFGGDWNSCSIEDRSPEWQSLFLSNVVCSVLYLLFPWIPASGKCLVARCPGVRLLLVRIPAGFRCIARFRLIGCFFLRSMDHGRLRLLIG